MAYSYVGKMDKNLLYRINNLLVAIAIEVINANDVEPAAFALVLRELILKERFNLEIILMVGLGNCDKTFI